MASAESDRAAVERFAGDLEAWLSVEVELLGPDDVPDVDWREAGLVVLTGGPSSVWVASLAGRDGERAVLEAAGEGSLIYAADAAAEALGAWIAVPGDVPSPGTRWLAGAMILAQRADPTGVPGVKEMLAGEDHSYAVGLGEGAVLALGPRGEVEVWGEARPTITLGLGWR
jgi:hypothetical protein